MLVDCRRTCGQVFYREEASSSTVRSQIEDCLVICPGVDAGWVGGQHHWCSWLAATTLCSVPGGCISSLERLELNFEWLSALWMMWPPNKFVAENENLKLLVNQTWKPCMIWKLMLNTAPMILEIRKRLMVSQKLNRGSTNMKTMHDLVVDVE